MCDANAKTTRLGTAVGLPLQRCRRPTGRIPDQKYMPNHMCVSAWLRHMLGLSPHGRKDNEATNTLANAKKYPDK